MIDCNDDHFLSQLSPGVPIQIDNYLCIIDKIQNNTIIIQLSDDLFKKKYFRHFVDHTLVSLSSPNTKLRSSPNNIYEVQLGNFKNGAPLLIHTSTHHYLIILAEALTARILLNFHSYGIVQVALEYSRACRLQLPLLLINGEYQTITCDLQGAGPAINDQINTIHQLTKLTGTFKHPGHVSPQIVSRWGPLKTVPEVSLALAKLVSKIPVTVMVALTNKDGNLMTTAEAISLGADQKIHSLFFEEIIEYLAPKIPLITSIKTIPIENMDTWELLEYSNYRIMIKGNIYVKIPIMYIHMVCNCIDDLLGIDEHGNLLQCACKRRYGKALKMIHDNNSGLIIFPKSNSINYSEIIKLLNDLCLTDLEVINYQPGTLIGFNVHNLIL
jgi:3,4-dihydroxy-2-butanone 4-phosphate synthase